MDHAADYQATSRWADGLCHGNDSRGPVDLLLSTPTCAVGAGAKRPARRGEREILDLWDTRELNTVDFTAGNVVAFLKQLRQLL